MPLKVPSFFHTKRNSMYITPEDDDTTSSLLDWFESFSPEEIGKIDNTVVKNWKQYLDKHFGDWDEAQQFKLYKAFCSLLLRCYQPIFDDLLSLIQQIDPDQKWYKKAYGAINQDTIPMRSLLSDDPYSAKAHTFSALIVNPKCNLFYYYHSLYFRYQVMKEEETTALRKGTLSLKDTFIQKYINLVESALGKTDEKDCDEIVFTIANKDTRFTSLIALIYLEDCTRHSIDGADYYANALKWAAFGLSSSAQDPIAEKVFKKAQKQEKRRNSGAPPPSMIVPPVDYT